MKWWKKLFKNLKQPTKWIEIPLPNFKITKQKIDKKKEEE